MRSETELLSTAFAAQFFRMHRLLDRALTHEGISLAKFKFLIFLSKNGTSRASTIADCLALAPRTVTEGLDGLERDGLIRRDPDPDDRRAKQVSLTAKGAEAIEAIAPLRDEMLERVMGSLTDRDRRDLHRILSLIEENVEQEEQRAGLSPPSFNIRHKGLPDAR